MQATYVARVTLRNEGDLSEVERILEIECFTEPGLYAVASSPIAMLVGPYQNGDGEEVRSFELTDYLVETGLLPKDPDQRGPVTQEMVQAVLDVLEERSSQVRLYRVSATGLVAGQDAQFFKPLSGYEDEGPGPFVMLTRGSDTRRVYVSKPTAGWDMG